ncbi:MAG: beta-lactamase family protein [Acidiferrobacterales bacterium]|nr:beta-lactamase family protein [Acidiferrobacterales bacterium]
MQGFPVVAENRIPRNLWDRAPYNRWSFQHIREVLATVEVWRGEGAVWELPQKLSDLSALSLTSAVATGKAQTITVNNWLDTSYTDGFLVMHRGEIVFERYMNHMHHRSLHLSQSMAKSVTASVAGVLIGRRLLDPQALVVHYLPELAHTAWNGATVQQVMDMTTGVRYIEDYEALDSDIAITDIASGWKEPSAGYTGPACIWDQILTLTRTDRAHGSTFQYRSIETDVLAHCMERVSQTRLSDLISKELWQPLGCENDACFTVDSAGYALADGGFNATLRDYARFGQMLLQNGFANGQQIVPSEWIADIHNTDGALFQFPYTNATPNGGYRNQFWIENVDEPAFMARGVFGQLIYVSPANQMVAVKLSSWPEFTSVLRLQEALSALHSIGSFLATAE